MTEETKPSTNTASSNLGSFAAMLLSVIAIGLVAAMGYFGYLRYQTITSKFTELEQSKGVYQNQIRVLQQSVEAQNAQVLALVEQRDAAVEESLQGLTDQVINALETMNDLSGKQDKSWLINEAYYLLKLANNRIMFMQDVDTALYLLNQADQLLGQLDDPNLFVTRQKLNEDRQRLNGWPKVDATGLAIRISALQSGVADLPMVIIAQEKEPEQEEAAPDVWYEHLLYSIQQLGDQWFTVRQHGSGYTPIISESDEQKLRFAIMMTLQTIQFAILNHNDDLYQANLLQLKSRLENYFDISDTSVQTIVLEIEQLLQVRVGYDSSEGITALLPLSNYLTQRETESASQTNSEAVDEPAEQSTQAKAVSTENNESEQKAEETSKEDSDTEEPPVG